MIISDAAGTERAVAMELAITTRMRFSLWTGRAFKPRYCLPNRAAAQCSLSGIKIKAPTMGVEDNLFFT